jgi:hypothetical protein
VEGATKGIQPGASTTDFNVIFPDVVLPTANWLPLSKDVKTVNGVDYDYVITSDGYYRIDSLNGSLLVNAPTNDVIRVYLPNGASLNGQTVIRVANTGALCRMYTAGNFILTGQAYIDNPSGQANRFYLFGLTNCTAIAFGGNADFYGGVYAPQADFSMGGGGNNTLDFVGSGVSRTINMNGHYNFHYDEDLANHGPSRGFIPVNWRER